jgi:hypothetical protein
MFARFALLKTKTLAFGYIDCIINILFPYFFFNGYDGIWHYVT